jgi:uncharacterized protein (TIGR02118 family)
MVQEKCGAACTKWTAETGLGDATYIAIGTLYFDTMDAFEKAFGPHSEVIMADIPKYTESKPIIQISEIVSA